MKERIRLWKVACQDLIIQVLTHLTDVFRRSVLKLSDPILSVSSRVVGILGQKCADALAPVKLIPGQLRAMSSKSIPTASSPFISTVLLPLKRFLDSKYPETRNAELYSKIGSDVFDVVVERFAKTLEHHKNHNDAGNTDTLHI